MVRGEGNRQDVYMVWQELLTFVSVSVTFVSVATKLSINPFSLYETAIQSSFKKLLLINSHLFRDFILNTSKGINNILPVVLWNLTCRWLQLCGHRCQPFSSFFVMLQRSHNFHWGQTVKKCEHVSVGNKLLSQHNKSWLSCRHPCRTRTRRRLSHVWMFSVW